jgi:hypothetical protein
MSRGMGGPSQVPVTLRLFLLEGIEMEKLVNSPSRRNGKMPVEYGIWSGIKHRCFNKSSPEYKNYGERGITVCDRWKRSYANFISDMGPRPNNNMSIDRIDNDGNYGPSNCRWATSCEQTRNSRRNIVLTYRGVSMIQTDWAKYLGTTPDILGQYLRRGGHTMDEAVNHYQPELSF